MPATPHKRCSAGDHPTGAKAKAESKPKWQRDWRSQKDPQRFRGWEHFLAKLIGEDSGRSDGDFGCR